MFEVMNTDRRRHSKQERIYWRMMIGAVTLAIVVLALEAYAVFLIVDTMS